jgi:integration host factor subunit beta
VTKSELVSRLLVKYPTLLQKEASLIVDAVFEEITQILCEGGRVELRGFGVFGVKTRPARTARNPRTGETVEVAAKVLPYFKVGKQAQLRLNPPETTETVH